MQNKTRIPITSQSIPLYRLCGGLQNLDRIAENAEQLGDYTTVKVSKYGIIFKTKNNKTAISFPDPSGVTGSECKIQQVFVFILCKIKEARNENKTATEFTFDLHELVDIGIYSNYCAAKKGIRDILSFIGGIRISTHDVDFLEIILDDNEKFVDATFSLFTYLRRTERGTVKVDINKRVNWNLLTKQFIFNSKSIFALPNNSFKLAMAILERIRIEKYNKPFDLSLKYVISRLNLRTSTKNPERDVKVPLRTAIDNVNAIAAELGFKIAPNYDESLKLSKLLESGYLTIVFLERRGDIEAVKYKERLANL